jgi:hypothetical protein
MVGAAAPGPVVELAGDDKLVPSSWEPKRMSSRNRRRCIPVHDLAITVRTNLRLFGRPADEVKGIVRLILS